MREQIAHIQARLTVFAKFPGRAQQLPGLAQISLRRGLAVISIEPRLGVESVDLRRPARHEKKDRSPRAGPQVWLSRCERIGRPGRSGGCLIGEQRRESNRTKTGTRPPQYFAAARPGCRVVSVHQSPLPNPSVYINKLILANDQLTVSFPSRSAGFRVQKPRAHLHFLGRRSPAEGQGIKAPDSRLPRRGFFAYDSCGERSGGFSHERVVQEKEGLRGNYRLASLADDRAGISTVKDAPEVGRPRARAHGLKIHCAPRESQIRERRTTDRGVESPGGGQETVTNRFRLEASAGSHDQTADFRIFGDHPGPRRLLCW